MTGLYESSLHGGSSSCVSPGRSWLGGARECGRSMRAIIHGTGQRKVQYLIFATFYAQSSITTALSAMRANSRRIGGKMPEAVIQAAAAAFATIGLGLSLLAIALRWLDSSASAPDPHQPSPSRLDQTSDFDVMELHPRHLGKPCQYCDALATHFNKGNKEWLCSDHEPTGLIEAFSYQIEWDLQAYLSAWRKQLLD